MISPVLVRRLDPPIPGWTVIVLELELSDDEFNLVRDVLSNINPEMLLFTRRLKEIQITFGDEQDGDPPVTNRYVLQSHASHFHTINKSPHSNLKKYFVWKQKVDGMPAHEKRENIKTSEIILAFPYNDSGPIIESQKLFAFLPLHKTSLPV